jgi:signal transduction histidine kinase
MVKTKRKPIAELSRMLVMPPLEPSRQIDRILAVERDLVLPVKLVLITYLFFDVFYTEWFWDPIITREFIQISTLQTYFFVYAALNLVGVRYLITPRSTPLNRLRQLVGGFAVLDILMLAVLSFITNGFESSVFWMFLALVVRNALSVPTMIPQLTLQVVTNLSFLLAGLFNAWVSKMDSELMPESVMAGFESGDPTDALVRIFLLALMTLCCYAVQVLFERQRLMDDEGREFILRNEQVKTAGRLAGEIAHQIKNPLSIINNTAWSLQRSLKDTNATATQQLAIIREEVDRSDRILTELMGYARLADGKVEWLTVNDEMDACIESVVPAGAGFETHVERRYGQHLPRLLMQQGHLREIFTNLLQNSREAMAGKELLRIGTAMEPNAAAVSAHGHGRISITTTQDPDDSVIVTIEDTGPGIAADRLEQVFEAYFTTKLKGSGLGLAIVRNNMELYGGSIRVESELGKGARFILRFSPRTLLK